MKNMALILALSFLALNVQAANLTCTSHDGKVQYLEFNLEIKDEPGIETYRKTWKYNDREVGSISDTHGKAGRLGTLDESSKINIDFVEDSTENLKTEVFVVKAEVPTSVGGAGTITMTLICQRVSSLFLL